MTAAAVAAQRGYREIVDLLTDYGAETSLTDFCIVGDARTLARMAKEGSDVNAKDSTGRPALQCAAEKGVR